MRERIKRVAFVDAALREAFQDLKKGRFEEKELAGRIEKAMEELKQYPFAGVVVPRRLWPKIYVKKHAIDNLRKYDLTKGWRLVYTLVGNEIEIVSIILEWFDHKGYAKRFGYKK